MLEYLLEVDHLKMHFPIYGGIFWHKTGKVHAVNGVSFKIRPSETLGLVGESGCGKTTVGRTLLRLYEPTGGQVYFENRCISQISMREMRTIRKNMQMIFQDPYESLNSRHTIGVILEEPFIIHKKGDARQRRKAVKELLELVGLPSDSINRFPHEFSGGQRQRIGIARAIALQPKLIVCDEPVSALDVSIQSQILNLLVNLQKEMGLSYCFITHDLAVVKYISDQIAVMYLGKIVEYTDAASLYQQPLHPYTKSLLAAIPVPDPRVQKSTTILKGDVPSPINPPSGCYFHPRCPEADELCQHSEPLLQQSNQQLDAHLVACHRRI